MTKYEKYKLILLSIFAIFLLLIMYDYSSNGRYIIKWEYPILMLDTKTGTIYTLEGKIDIINKSDKKK